MPRQLRFCYENACYHIISRGMRRENIFLSNKDRVVFLEKMNETFEKYSIICFAYCLMANHYHIFLKTPFPNISPSMHYLNSSYANWFAKKYDLKGSLFQGRFKSILVEEDKYSLNLVTYIHLNPLRAKIAKNLEEYEWSSYLDYTGKREPIIKNLDRSKILKYFGENYKESFEKYEEYIRKNNNMKNPLDEAYKGIILGSEEFIKKILHSKKIELKLTELEEIKLRQEKQYDEILSLIAKYFGIKLEEIFSKKRNNLAKIFSIYLINKHTSLTLNEIGKIFNMNYSSISQSSRRLNNAIKENKELREKLKKIEENL